MLGKPLWPLCQLNLTEAPWVPEILADIKLLALFILDLQNDDDFDVFDHRTYASAPGEAGWCVRTYASLDALAALTAPPHGSTIRESQIRYGDVTLEAGDVQIFSSKLGGWPNGPQSSDPWWENDDDNFSFAFQIDSESEADFNWGTDGMAVVWFGRSQRDPRKWAFDFQCS